MNAQIRQHVVRRSREMVNVLDQFLSAAGSIEKQLKQGLRIRAVKFARSDVELIALLPDNHVE